MNRVDGKVAVVTGGTQGLGAAVAKQLAVAGAAGIVVCGRSVDKGRAVADVPATARIVSDPPCSMLRAAPRRTPTAAWCSARALRVVRAWSSSSPRPDRTRRRGS